MSISSVVSLLFLFLVTLGCSKAEVGESCATPGETTSMCVDGALCTNNSDGSNTCRTLCTQHSDCTSPLQCLGVSNTTLKSCQP